MITTYGPGALIDLPKDSAIVGGLETWPRRGDLQEIHEPRLSGKLRFMSEGPPPSLYAPPPASNDPREPVGLLVDVRLTYALASRAGFDRLSGILGAPLVHGSFAHLAQSFTGGVRRQTRMHAQSSLRGLPERLP